MMDLVFLLHHAESTLLSRTHPDSDEKLWTNKFTEIGLVLDVKVICHHNVHGIKIQIPQHLKTKPILGWSYPEAQIVTWMNYDTENQKLFLKKLLKNVCKIKIKSTPKVKGHKPVCSSKSLVGPARQGIQLRIQVENPSLENCQ